MAEKKDVVAVIAAYNEEKYIADVIKKASRFLDTIIVVNDGSKDSTSSIARQNRAIVLDHIINLGKGAAIRTGCDYASKLGAEKIILIDADGQHDQKDIPRFVESLKDNDIAFGYRTFNKKMPLIFRLGNSAITLTARLLFHVSLNDTQCGYRAFKAEAYKKIRWQASDYSMESEMIANVGKARLKYSQIPVETIYAEKYKGTTILDGIKIMMNMIFWRMRR